MNLGPVVDQCLSALALLFFFKIEEGDFAINWHYCIYKRLYIWSFRSHRGVVDKLLTL